MQSCGLGIFQGNNRLSLFPQYIAKLHSLFAIDLALRFVFAYPGRVVAVNVL